MSWFMIFLNLVCSCPDLLHCLQQLCFCHNLEANFLAPSLTLFGLVLWQLELTRARCGWRMGWLGFGLVTVGVDWRCGWRIGWLGVFIRSRWSAEKWCRWVKCSRGGGSRCWYCIGACRPGLFRVLISQGSDAKTRGMLEGDGDRVVSWPAGNTYGKLVSWPAGNTYGKSVW